jgi:site-specific DNA-methyltransferase (adenine-specific)
MIEYFNEDCMVGMARYPDKHFDLAIVDPPYGLERFKKGGSHVNKYGNEKGKWNNEKPTVEYFDELFRVSKCQIVWGGNNFHLPTSEYFIIWQKGNAIDFSFAMCEYAWTNAKKPAKLFTHYHASDKDNRFHPTQKPVALYKWLLKNYAKQGDLILDTHVGSASSLIACYDMGFDAVGFELDADYYKASKQRLERHMAQIQITDLAPVIKPEQITFKEDRS